MLLIFAKISFHIILGSVTFLLVCTHWQRRYQSRQPPKMRICLPNNLPMIQNINACIIMIFPNWKLSKSGLSVLNTSYFDIVYTAFWLYLPPPTHTLILSFKHDSGVFDKYTLFSKINDSFIHWAEYPMTFYAYSL